MPVHSRPLPSQDILNFLFSYDPETGVLTWKNDPGRKAHLIGKPAGFIDRRDFKGVQIGLWGYSRLAHRVIWKMLYNEEPAEIDHKDNDPWNNRISNLRAATRNTNAQNTLSMRTYKHLAKLKGCYRPKNRNSWVSQIKKDGVHHYLGCYKTEQEAHEVYVAKAKELFGEFYNTGVR
jgi:hypothetical protein